MNLGKESACWTRW